MGAFIVKRFAFGTLLCVTSGLLAFAQGAPPAQEKAPAKWQDNERKFKEMTQNITSTFGAFSHSVG